MRTLITLLFISFTSVGQTYDDIMSIDGLNTFKKLMIENNFQHSEEGSTDDKIMYVDIQDTKGAMHTTKGYPIFGFYFNKTMTLLDEKIEMNDTPYDRIFDEVKEKCTFVKISEGYELEYACYECEDAKFEGMIGFAIFEGVGMVNQIYD